MRTRRFFSLYFLFFFLLLAFIPSPAIGADAVAFNPMTVAVEAKNAGGGVPVGTIVAWPVASNPEDMDNWLECNGQAVSQTAYPELFALVGARVPDYRGLFLRGVGGKSGALGVYQGDTVKSHRHSMEVGTDESDHGPRVRGGGNLPLSGTAYTDYAGDGLDMETRPVNKAVRYLIRALP